MRLAGLQLDQKQYDEALKTLDAGNTGPVEGEMLNQQMWAIPMQSCSQTRSACNSWMLTKAPSWGTYRNFSLGGEYRVCP